MLSLERPVLFDKKRCVSPRSNQLITFFNGSSKKKIENLIADVQRITLCYLVKRGNNPVTGIGQNSVQVKENSLVAAGI